MADQVEVSSTVSDVPALPFDLAQPGSGIENLRVVFFLFEVAETFDPAVVPYLHRRVFRLGV
ncbi:MAG: hypothetical protein ACRDXF_11400 [Acidimicrobiia bacterium]